MCDSTASYFTISQVGVLKLRCFWKCWTIWLANDSGSATCLTVQEPRLPRDSPVTESLQYVAASQLVLSLFHPGDQTNLDAFF